MGKSDEGRRRLNGGVGEPLGVKPAAAGAMIGESRSTIYRLLAAGRLSAVKRGGTTLVLVSSIRKYFADLPVAHFGADRPKPAKAVTPAPKGRRHTHIATTTPL